MPSPPERTCCCSAPCPEQQRTRERVSVSGAHHSGRRSGSAACSTPAQPNIYRACTHHVAGCCCRTRHPISIIASVGVAILHLAETARLTAPPAPPWKRAPPLLVARVQAAAVCAAGRAVLAKAAFESRLRSCLRSCFMFMYRHVLVPTYEYKAPLCREMYGYLL